MNPVGLNLFTYFKDCPFFTIFCVSLWALPYRLPRLLILLILKTLRIFVFGRTSRQPRRHLRSHLVLQRLCSETALSPEDDAL